jgi:hypothetical protein
MVMEELWRYFVVPDQPVVKTRDVGTGYSVIANTVWIVCVKCHRPGELHWVLEKKMSRRSKVSRLK